MSDDGKVIRPMAFAPRLSDEEDFRVKVAAIHKELIDMMDAGGVCAVGIIVDRGPHGTPVMWATTDGDPRPLLAGAAILKNAVLLDITDPIEDV